MIIPSDPSSWLGTFKGVEHSFLDCEILGLEFIEPAQRERMWQAQDTIWFDYARLHPVKSLFYFCHCYSMAYGDYLEKNIDRDMRYKKGIKGNPLVHRELRQLVALKTLADEDGAPYGLWIGGMFDWFAMSGWIRPPRPSHLVKQEEAREHAQMRWAELLESQVVHPKDPWFRTECFVGHPQQLRCEQHIIDSISERPNKDIAIASAVFEVGTLRIERALACFPEQTTDALRWQEHLNKW